MKKLREARLIWLVVGIVLLGAASAWAQVTNTNTGEVFATIQAAIDDPDTLAGHTISVAAGTYAEALHVNKSVTIEGAGTADVTINVAGLAGSNSSGIYVSVDDVHLSGFTLIGTPTAATPRYGIKYGEVSGGSLDDIVVENVYRSGFDFLGTSNTTVTNVVSQNNGGHGIALCDANNMTFSDITVSGNGWQGVSVATWGRWTALGTSGIIFTGTNTFVDVFQIEEGDFNNPGVPPAGEAVITYSTNPADGADITVLLSDFVYALHGDQDDGPDQNRVWLTQTLAQAQFVAAWPGPVGHLLASGRYIESLADPTLFIVSPGCSIQAAVDASASGDTIDVYAGAYDGGVMIDRPIDLFGNYAAVVRNGHHVPAPDVFHVTSDDVSIVGFFIQGAWDDGIQIDGDHAFIDGNEIYNNTYGIYLNPADWVSIIGNAIYNNTNDGILGRADHAFISDNEIYNNRDDGISLAGSYAVISWNEIHNNRDDGIDLAGSYPVIAGNEIYNNRDDGINLGGDYAFISNNEIRNNRSDGIDLGGDYAFIEWNTIKNNRSEGIDLDGDYAVIEWNDIRNNRSEGIDLDGNYAVIEYNTIYNNRSEGIDLDGNYAMISWNDIYYNRDEGIDLSGDYAVISWNDIYNIHGEGIYLNGDEAYIHANTIKNNRAGIELYGDYAYIEWNNIYNNDRRGLDLYGDYAYIYANAIYNNDRYGIKLYGDYADIVLNDIYNNDRAGIDLYGDSAEIIGNEIFNNDHEGIAVDGNNASIMWNNIYNNGRDGIFVAGDSANIMYNEIYANGRKGIELYGDYASIVWNAIYNNGRYGIWLNGDHAYIDGNEIYNNDRHGIDLTGDFATATWNAIYNNDRKGIEVEGDYAFVYANTIYNNGAKGIELDGDYAYIVGNEIYNNDGRAIDLRWTDFSTIAGNAIRNNGSGIYLYGVGNTVALNDIMGSTHFGIRTDYDLDDSLILGNVISGNDTGIEAFSYADVLWGIDYPENTGIYLNSIDGNITAGLNYEIWGDPSLIPALDASLNWWGAANGPTADEDGDGVPDYVGGGGAVIGNVIYSPWLGVDPDSDPGAPGVQLTSPMWLVVAPVGPQPELVTIDVPASWGLPISGTLTLPAGYLNRAIGAANILPGIDTIEVRHGTYDASEPITDSVNIVSEVGSATHTILNGPIVIGVPDVLLGRMRQGFTINGDITAGAGIDVSNIHINWNDIYGSVINNGVGTLDAIFNYWGADGPDTVGAVAIYPILYHTSDTIIHYMDDHRLSALSAIEFAILLDLHLSEREALAALELMQALGFSAEEAAAIVSHYGRFDVGRALTLCGGDYDDFLALLVGYASGGGGGGSFLGGGAGGSTGISSFCVGCLIPLQLELVHPTTGEPITDAVVSYSVCRTLPDGTTEIVLLGVMTYDGDLGAYTFDVDTTGLEPGIYDIYLGTNDGRSRHFQVEIVAY